MIIMIIIILKIIMIVIIIQYVYLDINVFLKFKNLFFIERYLSRGLKKYMTMTKICLVYRC